MEKQQSPDKNHFDDHHFQDTKGDRALIENLVDKDPGEQLLDDSVDSMQSSRSINSNDLKSNGELKKADLENANSTQVVLKTALTIGPHSTAIPEAMPLIRKISMLNSKEPEFQKFRRGTVAIQSQAIESVKEECTHEEQIEAWKCKLCNGSIAKFNHIFDDNQGKVNTYTKIVYENSFLEDFIYEFKAQMAAMNKSGGPLLIYNSYHPTNIIELKEYMFYLVSKKLKKQKNSPLGNGQYTNLSPKLTKYLEQHQERKNRILSNKYGQDILLFDSIFESGNLLQAQKSATHEDTYNLFMQVDTNTRGHQQWFYFRAKGGKIGKTYTFNIMNFTKPGVTGGRGYKSNEHCMRIVCRSKKRCQNLKDFEKWDDLSNMDDTSQCEYVKTSVARRKKDVIAAGADSDQEDWIEEAFNKEANNTEKQAMPQINMNGPETTQKLQGEGATTNEKLREKPKKRKVFYYYALRFSYTFKYDNDSVYFAFAKPITYTDIMNDLNRKEKLLMPKTDKTKSVEKQKSQQKVIETDEVGQITFQKNLTIDNPNKLIYYQRTEFCRSITGIPLYKIVIARDQKGFRKNQIVLITSRVHSGESPGSEVFRGIYNFIISDSREAKFLRKFYTFILIPCMNPDGVICGNYRNSLAGVDLNRQWINPEVTFHPEVCAVKRLMQQIKEEDKRQIWIYCDLHGHSKKKNSFFYGCNTAANGGFLSWTIVRLLPRIFAQKTHMFNYKDCRFRVEPYKIGTARIVAWKQFQITHSFTLENSFYGYDLGEEESSMFTSEDYQNIGLKFTMSIYEMHFVWKQIRRELQITHGWLKPRTLNEMTGVPAAQIIAEQAAQEKEDQRKKKAIEQYENFLKTFYKGNRIKKNDKSADKQKEKSRNTKLATEESKRVQGDEKVEQSASYTEKKQRREQIQSPPSAIEEADAEDEEDPEYMYKLHQGLVKIQSLIRGVLARKHYKKLLEKKQQKFINKQINQTNRIPRQRSNNILKKSTSSKLRAGRLNAPSQNNVGYDSSSDCGNKGTAASGENKNNQLESSGDNLFRSNTEQLKLSDSNSQDTGGKSNILSSISMFGSRGPGIKNNRLDWREYFDGDELDKAYQIVEVEQRDETDHYYSEESMGSNSDPSEDNFDEEEVYRNVYGVQNPLEILETKKMKEQEFIEKVQHDELTQAELLKDLSNKQKRDESLDKGNESNRSKKDKIEIKKFKISESQERLLKEGSILNNKNKKDKNQFLATTEDETLNFTPISKNLHGMENQSLAEGVSSINLQQVSSSPGKNGEFNQDNMFQNLQINPRRMLKSSNQQRIYMSNQNQPIPTMSVTNPVRMMIQQSYKIQNFSHKKENINQVIKDCFITKKMGPKSQKQTSQQHYMMSPQKLHSIYNQKKQNELNLKMMPLVVSGSKSQARPNHQQNQKNQIGDVLRKTQLQTQFLSNLDDAIHQNNLLMQQIQKGSSYNNTQQIKQLQGIGSGLRTASGADESRKTSKQEQQQFQLNDTFTQAVLMYNSSNQNTHTGGQFHPQHPQTQQQIRKLYGKRGQSSNHIIYSQEDQVNSPYSQYILTSQANENLPQLFTTMHDNNNQEPRLFNSQTTDNLQNKLKRQYETEGGNSSLKKRKQYGVSQTEKKRPQKFNEMYQNEQFQQIQLSSQNNSRETLDQRDQGSSLFMKYVKKKHQQEPKQYLIITNDQGKNNIIQIMVPEQNKILKLQKDQVKNQRVQQIYLNDIKDLNQLNELIQAHPGQQASSSQQFHKTQLLNEQQRINSAAVKHKNANREDLSSPDIVNTKELINEIKQLRVHQQQQLKLQQQINEQLLQNRDNIVYNQYNIYQNNMISGTDQFDDQINLKRTIDPSKTLNPQIDQKINLQKQLMKESQQIQLQAQDKIPLGLQGVMNKQANIYQLLQANNQKFNTNPNSIKDSETKKRAETRGHEPRSQQAFQNSLQRQSQKNQNHLATMYPGSSTSSQFQQRKRIDSSSKKTKQMNQQSRQQIRANKNNFM